MDRRIIRSIVKHYIKLILFLVYLKESILTNLDKITMHVPISNSTEKASVSFDRYGNLYLTFRDVNYQVNVDGRNKLFLLTGDYEIFEPDTELMDQLKIKKMTASNGMLFQKKIREELEELDSDGELDDEDYDLLKEDDDYWEDEKEILSEEEDCLINEDLIEKYGEHNQPFVFWSTRSEEEIQIYHRRDGDITSLYDTFIYENQQIIFRARSLNDDSIYRLIINEGLILFRPIGESDRSYRLVNLENTLTIEPNL